ncbi:hypothetical protein GSI_15630 [Ganoderma sinense ZZ0214-1]|uniref:Uncharacterized protein n=1 Tax=Ganoderma sinense ZZ0214-1 TaxID=1077348 RepID=A0A2G8RN41_9APHY|nr:hypothetical protein GSI_15630 [Ganoderma sinense ZZ0214-1]
MLQLPDSTATRLPSQIWRDFLHGVPDDPNYHTKNGKRAHEIKQVFGQVFAEQDLDPAATGEAEWRERHFDVVDDEVGPLVMWEICELGFRYELYALDRAIRSSALEKERVVLLGRIFPSDSLFSVVHLPPRDECGLFASLPHHRIPSLNALRDVLSQWPLFPQHVAARRPLQISDSVDTIHEVELALAGFYTQTFFDIAGRAPIIPHHCPRPIV